VGGTGWCKAQQKKGSGRKNRNDVEKIGLKASPRLAKKKANGKKQEKVRKKTKRGSSKIGKFSQVVLT